jgi:molybdopterin-guanine dinucleotide biosynthesis protein A
MKYAGFVLVGGNSSRMGRDKALLDCRGRPLAARVASEVREAAGSVRLVGPPERYARLGFEVVSDIEPGRGPLGGIRTALRVSEADWNLVVACDMPSLTSEFLRKLLAEAERSEADALMPVSPAGLPEPLCAVYRRDCLPAVETALREGRLKTSDAFLSARIVRLDVGEGDWFANMNTPEEWAGHLNRHG